MKNRRKETLEDLYRQHAGPLYYFLLKLSGSPAVAEDLVQETFVKATISIHTVKDLSVKAWLYQIARNTYLDEWRKRKRWQWVPFYPETEMYSPYGVPEDELNTYLQKQEVDKWLSLLPENYRSPLVLRESEELSYEEIAEALGMTIHQVKVNIHRARKKLASLGENREEDT